MMKTIGMVGFTKRAVAFFIFSAVVCFSLNLNAQFVADGETAVLDGLYTNIDDVVTVGTNGSFTLLVVTNGTVVTNSGLVKIGSSGLATHNRIVVDGPGSAWYNNNTFNVGYLGSYNELDILDGGAVTNVYTYL